MSNRSRGPNYREQIGTFVVTEGGAALTNLHPSKRMYIAPAQATTEAGIHAAWGGDLYAVLGDELTDGAYTVRLYYNPLVRLIWIGTIIMFLGGMISLTDRRLQGGRTQAGPRTAKAPHPVPAE